MIEDWEHLSASEIAQFVLVPHPDCHNDTKQEEDWEIIKASHILPVIRHTPLDMEQFEQLLGLKKYLEITMRIHRGGLTLESRKPLWKYLLSLTLDENETNYLLLRQKMIERLENDSVFQDEIFRIEKDVVRTDVKMPFYANENKSEKDCNASLTIQIMQNSRLTQLKNILLVWSYESDGFVQGQADLASMFLMVLQNEADAYWCLKRYMDFHQAGMFKADGSGITRRLCLIKDLVCLIDPELFHKLPVNLFCCLRWLLVCFRREFNFQDSLMLWDQVIASHYSPEWIVFLCAATLTSHKSKLMTFESEPDDYLKYFQSTNMNVCDILLAADELYMKLEQLANSKGIPLDCSGQGKISLDVIIQQINSIY